MALRPIDNELPTATPERPKKQAKVVVSSDKQCGKLNDENKLPPQSQPPPPPPAPEYIASQDLEPISDPTTNLQSVMDGLESKEWITVCDSLNDVRRLTLHHSSLLQPSLEKVMAVVVKAMKSPRSALCKTSIMASSDMFNTYKDELVTCGAFDQLLLQLLLKASQDKRFVCEEAERSLRAMVESINCCLLFPKLKACVGHANPRVRSKAAVSISICLSKMGTQMGEFGFVSLVEMGADLLSDRLPEAREAARSIVGSVCEAFTQNKEDKVEVWQNFCDANLTPFHALSVIKVSSPTINITVAAAAAAP